MSYADFLVHKTLTAGSCGVDVAPDDINANLFPFQRDIVRWALKKGRAAIFADTGLGKTAMQLAWAEHAAPRVLILAPLAVAHQTIAEGARFGIAVTYAKTQADAAPAGITITNYERLESIKRGRKFVGIELKPTYFNVACKNLATAEATAGQKGLFDDELV